MSAAPKIVETVARESVTAPHVYRAIADIIGSLSHVGIAKGRKNAQQGFAFRGIDDVYNALAPLLAERRLVMLPEVIDRSVTERQTKNGGALFYVVLRVRFHLVSAVDGTSHPVVVEGEAMDSADKATNKAMSAAYKYACLQTFCIPTEASEDADATTHEVSSIMPASAFDALRNLAESTGSDVKKWEAYIAKAYPNGVPMSAYERVAADIEKAAAARAAKAGKATKTEGAPE